MSNMTRKTRMIFVEEVLDNEKENNVYKSFEMQSKVRKKEKASQDAHVSPNKRAASTSSHSWEGGKCSRESSYKTPASVKDASKNRQTDDEHDDQDDNKQSASRTSSKKKIKKEPSVIEDSFEDIWHFENSGDAWVSMSPTVPSKFPMSATEEDVLETKDIVTDDECSITPVMKKALSSKTSDHSEINLEVGTLPKLFELDSEVINNQPTLNDYDKRLAVPTASNPSLRSQKNSITGLYGIHNLPAFAKLRNLHHLDDLKTMEDSMLYQKLTKMFLCMKLTGIFFMRKQRTSVGSKTRFFRNCSLQQAYCTLIVIVLTVNFLRSLTAFSDANFKELNSVLFFKFLTSIFFYESMSRAYLAYIAAYRKKGGLEELFLKIERICYPDGILPYEESLIRISHIFILVTFLISVANVGATAYGFFGPEGVQELYWNYLRPVSPDVDGIIYFKIFLLILTFVNAQVAILSLSFYSVVCYVLYKEFEYFGRTFAMKIREDGTFTDDIERFRIAHQKRCKLVVQTDQMCKYYIANTYITNIPLLILLLYSVVYTDDESFDESYRFISAFRMCYVVLQMLVVSVAATIVNTEAHAPLLHVHSIRVTPCVTSARQLEIAMFLNRLTGTSVGLTAWDMFVINKPTVLTVIGMILTYFFLLMQFKNPPPTCNCAWSFNGTNITNITDPSDINSF